MTSERLFNSFIHRQKLLYPPKQISGYAPDPGEQELSTIYIQTRWNKAESLRNVIGHNKTISTLAFVCYFYSLLMLTLNKASLVHLHFLIRRSFCRQIFDYFSTGISRCLWIFLWIHPFVALKKQRHWSSNVSLLAALQTGRFYMTFRNIGRERRISMAEIDC